eukprot:CAMPEP_0181237120 /NCGR_PEP_ID=MMETSP1096-20121128/38579_1 /TAXON_ID=156174 ORGANISM="Chrysochromulina ericina, Strain CCMP281" /NCGR_SAMPLE_ID=MMETSP1096 /ASSEMBLY_ACC=CAM_ASM_000453 /LENGTH=40 /DNA_ID= /DNA_START= /DNA_END= /DNA_ORIENTATION=
MQPKRQLEIALARQLGWSAPWQPQAAPRAALQLQHLRHQR